MLHLVRAHSSYSTISSVGRSAVVELTSIYAKGPFAAGSNLTIARSEGREIISDRALFAAAYLADVATRYVAIDQNKKAIG